MIYIFAGRLVLDYVAIVSLESSPKGRCANCAQLGFRHVGLRISAAIRLRYLQSLLALPVSNVDAIPHGHTTAIITTTATQLQDGISEKLCLLIQNISLAISAIVVAFVYSWLLSSVTIAGLVFVVLVYTFTTYALVNRWNEMVEADREGAAVAAETIASIRMVAACGAESKMVDTYAGWVKKAGERGQKMSKWIAVQSSLGKLMLLMLFVE
jgi:ABC-type bacteriocin/lantibiotic exporter with double-glycine peptidase domain